MGVQGGRSPGCRIFRGSKPCTSMQGSPFHPACCWWLWALEPGLASLLHPQPPHWLVLRVGNLPSKGHVSQPGSSLHRWARAQSCLAPVARAEQTQGLREPSVPHSHASSSIGSEGRPGVVGSVDLRRPTHARCPSLGAQTPGGQKGCNAIGRASQLLAPVTGPWSSSETQSRSHKTAVCPLQMQMFKTMGGW